MIQKLGDVLPVHRIKVVLSRFELWSKAAITKEGNPFTILCVFLFSGTDIVVGLPAK